jgi:hypothetical protein
MLQEQVETKKDRVPSPMSRYFVHAVEARETSLPLAELRRKSSTVERKESLPVGEGCQAGVREGAGGTEVRTRSHLWEGALPFIKAPDPASACV